MAKYPLIFDGKFRPMVGPPCHFELTDGAVSVSIRGSHLVAVPIIPRLRTELEELERERVSSGKFPTQPFGPTVLSWCARKTVESGCVDSRELNKYIVRPKFETATPFQAVYTIPPRMTFFTVIDDLKGYNQVRLDEKSLALTNNKCKKSFKDDPPPTTSLFVNPNSCPFLVAWLGWQV